MLRAIHFQIEKDKSAERLAFLDQYFRERRWRQWILLVLDSPGLVYFKVIASFTYALLRLPDLTETHTGIALWWSKNEKISLEKTLSPKTAEFRSIGLDLRSLWRFRIFSDWSRAWQNLRIAIKICRKESFPIAARALETMIFYQYFSSKVERATSSNRLNSKVCGSSSHSYYVSTQSQPHFSALNELSKRNRIKLCFVSHSPWVLGPLPIFCDAGIFWGRAGSEQFIKIGSKIKNVLYYYPENKTLPNVGKNKDIILLALSKNPNLLELDRLMAELQVKFPNTRIRIRSHPNSPFPLPRKFRKISSNCSLSEDLSSSIFMIAGNSTVHLECLLFRVPTFFHTALDGETDSPLELFQSLNILRWKDIDVNQISRLLHAYNNEFYDSVKKLYFSQSNFLDINENLKQIFTPAWRGESRQLKT